MILKNYLLVLSLHSHSIIDNYELNLINNKCFYSYHKIYFLSNQRQIHKVELNNRNNKDKKLSTFGKNKSCLN